MVLYKGKYDLRGLETITPEMEKDLDLAFKICSSYRNEVPCEMCGRCCHQPNIIIRPEEVERVSAAAGCDLYTFMTSKVVQTSDGIFMRKENNGPCPFLRKDNKCSIWKDRPMICDDFPYVVSMFMSRVYLALTNPEVDILGLLDYMDESWPCTRAIKETIRGKVEEGRKTRSG
ncbi:MAG: YkgJ family cysteine cluster protein [Thermoplasmata archaeon]|nr:YkgJ family cysteine cluster protein [Thermoplasmata archaeon]